MLAWMHLATLFGHSMLSLGTLSSYTDAQRIQHAPLGYPYNHPLFFAARGRMHPPGRAKALHPREYTSELGTATHIAVCPVSRSEAGQQKQLLILDEHFQEVEALDLDLGPRHYALAHAAAMADSLPANLRRGDKCALLPALQALGLKHVGH